MDSFWQNAYSSKYTTACFVCLPSAFTYELVQ